MKTTTKTVLVKDKSAYASLSVDGKEYRFAVTIENLVKVMFFAYKLNGFFSVEGKLTKKENENIDKVFEAAWDYYSDFNAAFFGRQKNTVLNKAMAAAISALTESKKIVKNSKK